MDVPTSALRTALTVAELGSLSAAARRLGYTQSAVSRQIASLEQEAGHRLFERGAGGVRLTRAGSIVVRRAAAALAELDAVAEEIAGTALTRPLRVGLFPTAGILFLPSVLQQSQAARLDLPIRTRQASTPLLVRALRSGTLDLAVISQRPPYRAPDAERPPLTVLPILDMAIMVGVGAGGAWSDKESLTPDDLVRAAWIVPPSSPDEPQIGLWPRLPGRPSVLHRTNDWLLRLQLVVAGAGVTSIPGPFLTATVPGLRALHVEGLPEEARRISLAWIPGREPQDKSRQGVVQQFLQVADDLQSAFPAAESRTRPAADGASDG